MRDFAWFGRHRLTGELSFSLPYPQSIPKQLTRMNRLCSPITQTKSMVQGEIRLPPSSEHSGRKGLGSLAVHRGWIMGQMFLPFLESCSFQAWPKYSWNPLQLTGKVLEGMIGYSILPLSWTSFLRRRNRSMQRSMQRSNHSSKRRLSSSCFRVDSKQ